MFRDLDIVKIRRDIVYVKDSTGEIVTLLAGTYGTVLIVYSANFGYPDSEPVHYELEFCDAEGHTLGLLPVSGADLEFDSSYEQGTTDAKAGEASS